VQVLAIGQESVASERTVATKGVGGTLAGGKGDQRMVTLMVDQSQAQALQLASQRGTVSLSMRNPLDQDRAPTRSTRLVDLAGQPADRPPTATFAGSILQAMMTNMQAARNQRPALAAKPVAKAEMKPRLWEMEIVRGAKIETRTFPMPAAALDQKAMMTGPVEAD
jgi:Flp pilus assembly protein CpaB